MKNTLKMKSVIFGFVVLSIFFLLNSCSNRRQYHALGNRDTQFEGTHKVKGMSTEPSAPVWMSYATNPEMKDSLDGFVDLRSHVKSNVTKLKPKHFKNKIKGLVAINKVKRNLSEKSLTQETNTVEGGLFMLIIGALFLALAAVFYTYFAGCFGVILALIFLIGGVIYTVLGLLSILF